MGWTVALMAASAGMKALGNVAEGQSKYRQLNYQANIADLNAMFSGREGEAKGDQSMLKTAANIGSIRAGQAARGIDVNSGSAARVQDSARALGKMDARTIKSDAAREAYGYKTKAQGLRTEAKTARSTGIFNAIGSLIGGAADISGMGGGQATQPLGGSGTASASNPASWVTWGGQI